MGELAPPTPVTSLRAATDRRHLQLARTCYDHLAGRLGVAITDALVAMGALAEQDGVLHLGARGTDFFSALGIDMKALEARRRPVVLTCMDWTEARRHLAGALGCDLQRLMAGSGWIRKRRTDRGVEITGRGRSWLRDELGVDVESLASADPAGDAGSTAPPSSGTQV